MHDLICKHNMYFPLVSNHARTASTHHTFIAGCFHSHRRTRIYPNVRHLLHALSLQLCQYSLVVIWISGRHAEHSWRHGPARNTTPHYKSTGTGNWSSVTRPTCYNLSTWATRWVHVAHVLHTRFLGMKQVHKRRRNLQVCGCALNKKHRPSDISPVNTRVCNIGITCAYASRTGISTVYM